MNFVAEFVIEEENNVFADFNKELSSLENEIRRRANHYTTAVKYMEPLCGEEN